MYRRITAIACGPLSARGLILSPKGDFNDGPCARARRYLRVSEVRRKTEPSRGLTPGSSKSITGTE